MGGRSLLATAARMHPLTLAMGSTEVDALRKRVAELEGQLGRSEDAAPAHAEKALCDMPQPRRREVLQRVFQQRPDAKLLEQVRARPPPVAAAALTPLCPCSCWGSSQSALLCG